MIDCTFEMGKCYACGHLFFFNPVHLPSFAKASGARELICLQCLTSVNKARADVGMHVKYIHPNAYDPCDENELL